MPSLLSNSISGLLMQVAKDPRALVNPPKSDIQTFASETQSLGRESGFIGVKRNVEDERFVGSGLQLELELSSGQVINLNIEKRLSGGVRDVSLQTSGELSEEDADKLKRVFEQLGNAVDALFMSDAGNKESVFDFVNMQGIKDIEFTAQVHEGNTKQRLEFEKHHTDYGRKEIEAQWSRYHQLTGQKEQHDLALSKEPKDAAMAYGKMDYQWVVDQVKAGLGVIGNEHTGDLSIQNRVSDFFVSAVHSLFSESQNSHRLLQSLGVAPSDSKNTIGKTIRVMTSEKMNNKNGTANLDGSNKGLSGVSGLQDFKAHFSSQQNHSGAGRNNGKYNLAMEISQTTHLTQGINEDEKTQAQFRRFSLMYESQLGREEYEYNWRHDETYINQYHKGLLEKGYVKIEDIQKGVLFSAESIRDERSHFMQRKEYDAKGNNQPSLKHGYVKPETYTERGSSINHII